MNPPTSLLDTLKAAGLPEEDREAAEQLAVDLTGLMAAQLTGLDVSTEIAQLKAQAANMAATSTARVTVAFRLWSARMVGELLRGAI